MKAHKNSGINTANQWRAKAIFASMLLLLASLFISRGALSVSTILFVCLALLHKDSVAQLRTFFTTPFPLFFSLLFFIPFLSGLWSNDLAAWADVVRTKLPLLFLPLAFAGRWQLSQQQWRAVACFFLLLTFAGCVWGLRDYLHNTELVHESYLRAKTIPTPLGGDHIRFSWMVCVAVVLCSLLAEMSPQRRARILLIVTALFFTVYLHVLSARTGVLSLYIFLLLYAGSKLVYLKKTRVAVGVIALLVSLPLIAYLLLPTFRARIRYNLYDLSFVQKSEYKPGTSDGKRVLSLKAGWQLLQDHPFGVGAGDVTNETNRWYAANVPQVLPSDQSNPSSEWLMYGGFAGWPGVALFTFVMVLPFLNRPKNGAVFWVSLAATAAFSFVFDMGLEVQYGIFLYAFLTFWWWRWFHSLTYPQQMTD